MGAACSGAGNPKSVNPSAAGTAGVGAGAAPGAPAVAHGGSRGAGDAADDLNAPLTRAPMSHGSLQSDGQVQNPPPLQLGAAAPMHPMLLESMESNSSGSHPAASSALSPTSIRHAPKTLMTSQSEAAMIAPRTKAALPRAFTADRRMQELIAKHAEETGGPPLLLERRTESQTTMERTLQREAQIVHHHHLQQLPRFRIDEETDLGQFYESASKIEDASTLDLESPSHPLAASHHLMTSHRVADADYDHSPTPDEM